MDQNKQAVCPVCGMEVKDAKLTASYEGEQYTFCSKECKKKFEQKPEQYILG